KLRADNADQRLTPLGIAVGVVGETRRSTWNKKEASLVAARKLMAELKATPKALEKQGLNVNQDGVWRSAHDLLSFPEMTLERLAGIWPELGEFSPEIAEQITIDAKYAGYLDRQDADIAAFRKDEGLALSEGLDYAAIPSLSTEIRNKLAAAKPATLGAAARIPGVTPAALTALLRHVRNRNKAA